MARKIPSKAVRKARVKAGRKAEATRANNVRQYKLLGDPAPVGGRKDRFVGTRTEGFAGGARTAVYRMHYRKPKSAAPGLSKPKTYVRKPKN